jgi:putative transposase
MVRLPRFVSDELVYHAINRGNNRAPVFADRDDYQAFLESLAKTKSRYPFRLLGYCLMSNHFHLLLRPGPEQSISRILQSLTVAHTQTIGVSSD